jgi:N-acylneuraminate cytidylyltransferase
MSNFAFIFARGGSKGVVGKNIKPIAGKPLIAHSIELALANDSIDQLFVSTDNDDIASVAEKYGAQVPVVRPAHLATDNASEWLAWQHAVSFVKENIGDFERFISLPTTAPCRSHEDVSGAIEKLESDVDIVVTATESHHHPCFNMLKFDQGAYSKFIDSDADISRRQDVQQAFNMTTVAYVSRPDFILNSNSLWDGRMQVQIVNALNAIDIDSEDDFKLAELVLKNRFEG